MYAVPMCQKFKNGPLVAVLINKICAAQVKVLITVLLFLYFYVSLSAIFHVLLALLLKNFDGSLHKMAASGKCLDLDLRPPVMYL